MDSEAGNPEYGTFDESKAALSEPTGPFVSMYPKGNSRNRMLCCLLILSLVLTFVFFTWLNGVKAYPSRTSVVIDAGSSHTHFTLFSWKNVEKVEILGKCTIDKGLSTLEAHNVNDNLEACLTKIANIKGIIPNRTRVFLGATAGMRHMSPDVSEPLMEAIRSSLESSAFDFRESKDASILSGETEGLYDWLTINYLSSNSSIGVMDMGGASCQLSYECDKSNDTHSSSCSQNALRIHFKHENRRIFTKSEHCYGINSAYKRYLLDLIHQTFVSNKSLSEDIHDSCLSNSGKMLELSFLLDNECSHTLDYFFDLKIKELPSNHTFTFVPSVLNQTNCSVRSLFEDCVFQDCFPSYPPLPNNIHRFIGEASLYWEFYEILDERTKSPGLESIILQKCREERDSGENPSDCFKLNYIHKLLKDGYNFREDDNIQFLDVYKKIDANWSLGLLIVQHPDFRDIFWKK